MAGCTTGIDDEARSEVPPARLLNRHRHSVIRPNRAGDGARHQHMPPTRRRGSVANRWLAATFLIDMDTLLIAQDHIPEGSDVP
jgi:hypothetical protein